MKIEERLFNFLSRKFLLATGSIVFFILGGVIGKFDWQVVADGIKLIALGYIGVEGGADIVGRLNSK